MSGLADQGDCQLFNFVDYKLDGDNVIEPMSQLAKMGLSSPLRLSYPMIHRYYPARQLLLSNDPSLVSSTPNYNQPPPKLSPKPPIPLPPFVFVFAIGASCI